MEYNGEMYYAYFIVAKGGLLYSKTKFVDGIYENHTLYYLEGGEMVAIEFECTITALNRGYIEPHVSVCKDTSKVNYNRGTLVTRITSHRYDDTTIYLCDGNGKLLVELDSNEDSGFIKVPSNGTLMTKYGDFMLVIDGDDSNQIESSEEIPLGEFDEYGYEEYGYIYKDVPKNAKSITVYSKPV